MRACLGRGCEGPRRTPLRSQGTAACHSHFIVVQFRIAPAAFLLFLLSKEVTATPGGGVSPGVPGGVGGYSRSFREQCLIRSQGNKSSISIRLWVPDPTARPARPGLVRVAVGCSVFFFPSPG